MKRLPHLLQSSLTIDEVAGLSGLVK